MFQKLYLSSILLCTDNYHCSKPTCPFKIYDEGIHYGYYSKSNGDCDDCKRKCDNDVDCGAVECGKLHCSWWKNGYCNTYIKRTWNRQKTNNSIRTCIKLQNSKSFSVLRDSLILKEDRLNFKYNTYLTTP